MRFGCWWFLNNPSLVEEITAMRLETLGLSFILSILMLGYWSISSTNGNTPRRSLVMFWLRNTAIAWATGWQLTEDQVQKDVEELFQNNFYRFCAAS